MKKIMFNDKYGLTEAVLTGRKTMTRRLMTMTLHRCNKYGQMVSIMPDDMFIASDGTAHFQVGRNGYMVPKQNQPAYHVGEELAVAQSYSNLREVLAKRDFKRTDVLYDRFYRSMQMGEIHDGMPGWNNKMFVKAEYMPHYIRITDIKVERLQDISDENCLREGIVKTDCVAPYGFPVGNGKWKNYRTPQDAFACLIDKISGKGTWERNPWVFAYSFELIK